MQARTYICMYILIHAYTYTPVSIIPIHNMVKWVTQIRNKNLMKVGQKYYNFTGNLRHFIYISPARILSGEVR